MLWSTRTSSSRQVVGSDSVWLNAGNPPRVNPGMACGISASSAEPVDVGVMEMPGKGSPVDGSTGQSAPGQTSEKLPPRSASEGTFTTGWPLLSGGAVVTFFSRRHSSEKKKKVFFLSAL